MERIYPNRHILTIKALDSLVFLIGLTTFACPFLMRSLPGQVDHFFPGDIDTTSHVALGALICILASFRVAIAFGSIWIDIVLMALGLIVFRLPVIMHMQWNGGYTTGHMAGGGAIMGLSLIAMLITIPQINKKTSHS